MAWYPGFLVPRCTATKLAPENSPWTLNKTWLDHLVWWFFPVLNMTRVHFWNIASFQSLQTCLNLWGDRLSPSSALTRYRYLRRASLGVMTDFYYFYQGEARLRVLSLYKAWSRYTLCVLNTHHVENFWNSSICRHIPIMCKDFDIPRTEAQCQAALR